MIAARRTRFNCALQHAVQLAQALRKPLVVLEALRVDYPHASDRLHTFVIQGMRDNGRAFARSKAAYYPYIEPRTNGGRGLLEALAADAATVVTDWFPSFFLPRMVAAAAARLPVRVEAVDGNGLVPVADHGRAYPTARGYRGFVQRALRDHLAGFPLEAPLAELTGGRATLPERVTTRWPAADLRRTPAAILAGLPIDHTTGPVETAGGPEAAADALARFLETGYPRYADEANHPDADCTSRLSPYLHFGHLASHDVFSAVMTHERWTTRRLGKVRSGSKDGWWNLSPSGEQFIDQLVVWRELAFNGAAWGDGWGYDQLPAWARRTLDAHRADPRPTTYSLKELDAGATADPVWNAAHNELRRTGWFHGYMRMVWGKKILEWSRRPEEALARMAALMNRYSLDGRDPVSDLNFSWVLGRYDRPWFDRPIFGSVRYMTSESARRKLRMKQYLETFRI